MSMSYTFILTAVESTYTSRKLAQGTQHALLDGGIVLGRAGAIAAANLILGLFFRTSGVGVFVRFVPVCVVGVFVRFVPVCGLDCTSQRISSHGNSTGCMECHYQSWSAYVLGELSRPLSTYRVGIHGPW